MCYIILQVSEPTVLLVILTPGHTFIWCLLHTPNQKTPNNVIYCLDLNNQHHNFILSKKMFLFFLKQDKATVIWTKGDSMSALCPIKET